MRAVLALLLVNLAGALVLAVSTAAAQSERPEVVVGKINGIINPVMAEPSSGRMSIGLMPAKLRGSWIHWLSQ